MTLIVILTVRKEIRIVTFPNEQALLAYQKDRDLRDVMHLRGESQ